MGYTKPWATRLFNGTLETLSEENVVKLEKLLDIKFFRLTKTHEEVSGLGIEVSQLTKDSPELVKAIQSVIDLYKEQVYTPPYFTTKQLVGLGEEVIRLAHADQDKPGKVGRKVLELVSQDPKRRKRKSECYPTADPAKKKEE